MEAGKFVQRAFIYPDKRSYNLFGEGDDDTVAEEAERLRFDLDQLPSIRERLAVIEHDLRRLTSSEDRVLSTKQVLNIISGDAHSNRDGALLH